MIVSHPLTPAERSISQKNYNRFCCINGLSYMCLGETVIILFALQLNMPNVLLSSIGAMLYIGFLLLPLGIWRTAKIGAAQSQADFWVYRNISALLVASSALISLASPPLAWGILLVGAFLFYGFRAAGVVMCQPLIGEITTPPERANLIGKSTALFYLSGVAALLIISFILKLNSSLPVLCCIIIAGACLGITASGYIRGICETETIRRTARQPLLPQLRQTFRDPATRRIIAAGAVANFTIILIAPISVLALKKGCGVSDTAAVLFSAIQFASSILASAIFGKIPVKHLRKVVLAGYCCAMVISLIWLIVPQNGAFTLLLPAGIFFLQGFMVLFQDNALICYFLMRIPPANQIAASVAVNVIKGTGSGLAGLAVAGALIWIAGNLIPEDAAPLTLYRWYFGMIFVLLLCIIKPIRDLKKIAD